MENYLGETPAERREVSGLVPASGGKGGGATGTVWRSSAAGNSSNATRSETKSNGSSLPANGLEVPCSWARVKA